ncbi:MAG: hypothetical protein Q4E55_07285 [Bacteroidales bacterium]|nr:hypothetical protein [Bacteroidales bacterium]
MKKKTLLILILISFQTVGWGFTPAENNPKPPFKMIVRLWSQHHTDSMASNELVAALQRYPNFCDEVWFLTETPTVQDMDLHRRSAEQMGRMARTLRGMGINASFQFISVGHPESTVGKPDSNLLWGKAMGAGGEKTMTQSCPRQPSFLRHIEQVMAVYAQQVQPYGAWIDDDLRLTQHSPAQAICYCDDCINLFNKQHGYGFTRQTLVSALSQNADQGKLREQWIRFGQESLAGVAAAAAKGVHATSPATHMGLQHVNFHRSFLEGYDWNPIFDAFERETHQVPLSRPGHGFYSDAEPRGMLVKGLDMARQIRRLNSNITEIAPEIEGYMHRFSGKSAHGICIETMYYLAMGATQMSYAVVCTGDEPMSWYADHYFKHLQRWHEFAHEYADYNWGTQPGGIDPYLSRTMYKTTEGSDQNPMAWASTESGGYIYALAALGLPFCPDGKHPAALMLDKAGLRRMTDAEIAALAREHDLVFDKNGWNEIDKRGLAHNWHPVHPVSTVLHGVSCFESSSSRRAVVIDYDIPSVGISSLNWQQRVDAIDWSAHNRLPAIIESPAQAALIPRIDDKGNLRSVALLNCTISEEENYVVRLRLGKGQELKRLTWHRNGQETIVLQPQRDGNDVLATIPQLDGWDFGWIKVE